MVIVGNTGIIMRLLIYLTFIVFSTANAANIHKWVDEEGNVHYSDSPPVSTSTEKVRVIGAPSNPGRALPRLGNSTSLPLQASPKIRQKLPVIMPGRIFRYLITVTAFS